MCKVGGNRIEKIYTVMYIFRGKGQRMDSLDCLRALKANQMK